MNIMQNNTIASFQKFIWNFYREQGRLFAWRNCGNPYHVVVSEIMLQQTQTYRVEPKYEQFIARFPDFQTLANAPLRDVLAAWQGLGYNRRGKYLQQIAQKVVSDFNGILPNDPEILETFPGIGKGTAGSICAFAFNRPTVFIETNIRTVFIHSFFYNQDKIHDKELLPLIADALDHENPREWYYALMDYGVHLKKLCVNPSRKSKHHTKQSKFEGSDRQIRGMIIKLLTEYPSLEHEQLLQLVQKGLSAEALAKEERQRVVRILTELQCEQLIACKDNCYCIV